MIELLIVIALFMIFGTFALIMSMDSYRAYSFRSEASIATSVLERARNQSMVNLDQAPHGVRVDATQYTIFEGTSYAARVPSLDQVIVIGPAVTMTGNTPLPLDIIFDQIGGSVATPGTITVTAGNRSTVITINSEGGILW